MNTARLRPLNLVVFLNAQLVSFAMPETAGGAPITDPGSFAHDPKLFLLIGFGLLAIGLVANRRYRS